MRSISARIFAFLLSLLIRCNLSWRFIKFIPLIETARIYEFPI